MCDGATFNRFNYLPMDGTQPGGGAYAQGSGGTQGTTGVATNIGIQNAGTGYSQNIPPALIVNYLIKK